MKVYGICTILVLTMATEGFAQKKNADYYFDQGVASMEDNKYVMALANFNECLRLEPYYWPAYPARAAARERRGDAKGALTDFNIFIDKNPGESEALLGRATLRYQLGQFESARADFLQLIKKPSQITSTVMFRQTSEGTNKMFTLQGSNHADFFNYLGLIETRLKDYPQAAVYFDSAIHLSPEDPQLYVNRGLLKEHRQDTTGAIEDYRRATSIEPSNSHALHNLAAISRARGGMDESERLLDAAIVQSPSLPGPYAARAFHRFQHQHYLQAPEDYNRVVQLDPQDAESIMYRGMVKEKLKDQDGAFVDYTESISIQNDYARAWMARATLLTKLNRIPEAIEDYSVAILWYPDFGLAFYNRGIAWQKSGKLKEACDDLRKAAQMNVKVDQDLLGKVCGAVKPEK